MIPQSLVPIRRMLAVIAAVACMPAGAQQAFGAGDVWKGSYVCAQGPTPATLRFRGMPPTGPGDKVFAIFEFGGGALPQGIYLVKGSYDAGTRRLVLEPDGWVKQAGRYVAVGMSGQVDDGPTRFTGRIHDPRCGEITMTREARAAGAVDEAAKGAAPVPTRDATQARRTVQSLFDAYAADVDPARNDKAPPRFERAVADALDLPSMARLIAVDTWRGATPAQSFEFFTHLRARWQRMLSGLVGNAAAAKIRWRAPAFREAGDGDARSRRLAGLCAGLQADDCHSILVIGVVSAPNPGRGPDMEIAFELVPGRVAGRNAYRIIDVDYGGTSVTETWRTHLQGKTLDEQIALLAAPPKAPTPP